MADEMQSHMDHHRSVAFRMRLVAALALAPIVVMPLLWNPSGTDRWWLVELFEDPLSLTFSRSYLKLFALQTSVLVAWVGLLLVRPVRFEELLRASGVGTAMLALFAWGVVSTAWSDARWAAAQPLVELGYMALAVVGFANLLTIERVRRWLTIAYGCSAAVVCVVYFVGKVGAESPQAALKIYPFDNPNLAGAFAILPLVVGVAYVAAALRRRVNWRAGLWGGVVALACVAALMASRSAAALIGAAGAVALVIIYSLPARIRKYPAEVIAVLAILLLLWPILAPETWPDEWITRHLGARPALWKGGMTLVRERPLLGHGLGAFPVQYTRVLPVEYAAHEYQSTDVLKAHSLPLHVQAELGVVGLVLAGAFVFFAARRARQAGKRVGPAERPLLCGLVCGCLGMLAQGMVGVPPHYVQGYVPLVIALAMMAGMAGPWWQRRAPGAEPSAAFGPLLVVLLAGVYLFTAGPGLLSQVRIRQAMYLPVLGGERAEKLMAAIDTGWPTLWTLEAREQLATTCWDWGEFLEKRAVTAQTAEEAYAIALEQVKEMDRLAPGYGNVRLKEAMVRFRLRQYAAAADALVAASRKDPFSETVYAVWTDTLGAVARQKRPHVARPDVALECLRTARRFNVGRFPASRAWKYESLVYFHLGDLPGATCAIVASCRANPSDKGAYELWADVLRAAKKEGRARVARPGIAVECLRAAEEADTKDFPASAAREFKLLFGAAARRLPPEPAPEE